MLTRDAILAANDLPREEVQVPEWGGSVFVTTMTGIDRDSFEQGIVDAKQNGGALINVRARLAVRTVCDAHGKRIFTDDDADVLGNKSGRALDRLFDVAQRLNGIGEKEVAELEGNS